MRSLLSWRVCARAQVGNKRYLADDKSIDYGNALQVLRPTRSPVLGCSTAYDMPLRACYEIPGTELQYRLFYPCYARSPDLSCSIAYSMQLCGRRYMQLRVPYEKSGTELAALYHRSAQTTCYGRSRTSWERRRTTTS